MNHTPYSQLTGSYVLGQPRTLLYDREDCMVIHDYFSMLAKLAELNRSMISRIRGYWESPRRSLACTFVVVLIDDVAYCMPKESVSLVAYGEYSDDDDWDSQHVVIPTYENMAGVCTELPSPGTLLNIGSTEWRDAFRRMNPRLHSESGVLLRRIIP
jgi:hypothetical protein